MIRPRATDSMGERLFERRIDMNPRNPKARIPSGPDPMQRRFEPSAETYWIERSPPTDPDRYFQQF